MAFHVQVFENETRRFAAEIAGILELGRQQRGDPGAVAMIRADGNQRLIVADKDFTELARQQLRVEPLTDGTLRLTNLSSNVALRFNAGEALEASASLVVSMPLTVYVSTSRFVTFQENGPPAEPELVLEGLSTRTLAPGMRQAFSDSFADLLSHELSPDGPDLDRIVRGLREAMEIYQNVRTVEGLYNAAVTGAVKVVGFDGARLLRYTDGVWQEVQQFGNFHSAVSQFVLGEVLKHTKALWNSGTSKATESLVKLDAVIAVPILNRAGAVIGALYGERQSRVGRSAFRMITPTDAQLMELLAHGVASELSRQTHEEESRRLQIRFEQFFSPELARELEAQPNLLEGRDVEVSILFCDIQGFSRISERVDTQTIFKFINEVIGACSACVVKHGGVLVDYVGDAVMAMWGAPQLQPNHAELACRAALDMLTRLPDLNTRWESLIGEEVHFSIGINSGQARAGNAGSEHKFKYGPLGKTVNLASRVQGATKYFKTRILITTATAKAVSTEFYRRKLCDGQVVNMLESVGLFELNTQAAQTLNHGYEQALERFESKEFRIAARQLSHLLEEFPNDGPTLVLLSRCVNAIVDGPEPDHPVLILKSK